MEGALKWSFGSGDSKRAASNRSTIYPGTVSDVKRECVGYQISGVDCKVC